MLEIFQEGEEAFADAIAHFSEEFQPFFMGAGSRGGVGETYMQPPPLAQPNGTVLGSIVAHRDDHVKRLAAVHIHVLGSLSREAHADFGHRFNSQRVHVARRLSARGECFPPLAEESIDQPLGHLAAG